MAVTLKDIAEKAGVSISTVSIVVNKKTHRIPDKTRNAILKIAEEMNYTPNQNAVGLSTKRTMRIGVLVDDISNAYHSEIAKGAEAEAEKHAYSTLLTNVYTTNRRPITHCFGKLIENGADGFILAIASNDVADGVDGQVEQMQAEGKPVVFIGKPFSYIEAPDIELDHERGGYLATKHLLKKGHKKVGCITGPMGYAHSRLSGYITALQEYGLKFDTNLIYDGNYRWDSGYLGAKTLIPKGVSAIFACNDLMAYGVSQYAMEEEISIPDQLALVGYDDLPFSKLMPVPLTSIRQPAFEIGVKACQTVLDMISRNSVMAEDYHFKPELIVRKSA